MTTAASPPGELSRQRIPAPAALREGGLGRRKAIDWAVTGLFVVSAILAVGVLTLILGFIGIKGAPALNAAFFTQQPAPLGEVGGGVAPAILGSLVMVAIGGLLGVPAGVAAGVYLAEYGNGRLGHAIRFVADLLTGIPSIAIGAFVWVILVRRVVGNYNAIAGGAALAVIIVPIVTRTVEEMLKLVPNSLREASLALGAPRWKTIARVVLPTARGGITTGIILALARAGGETAPLLLTALGNQFFSFQLTQPMSALPLQIYNYAKSPYSDSHTKAWGSSLVLILLIAILSLATRLATRRVARG